MRIKPSVLIISSLILAPSAFAAGNDTHTIIAPSCFIKNTPTTAKKLASIPGYQMLLATTAEVEKLAAGKKHGKEACGGFVDVSLQWDEQSKLKKTSYQSFLTSYTHHSSASIKKADYKIQYEKEVSGLISTITPQNMWDNLTTLTNFKDRYANSDNGVKAAEWIKKKIESIALETGHSDVVVYYVATGNKYSQPSVVAKFGDSNEPGIVVGGHMDTLNSTWENKPGADDDGSGSVTVMETARTVLASGMKFKKPIYFIWYSAEEMGLVGSGYVVQDFTKKKIPVDAAIQLDMTGYAYKNDPTIWLMSDFVSKDLTTFLSKLITTYVKQPYKLSRCGYACSDHASWNQAGIPASFPFESEMGNDDPYIHTSNDKMDVLSLNHMTDFVKLATAFTVELATPISN